MTDAGHDAIAPHVWVLARLGDTQVTHAVKGESRVGADEIQLLLQNLVEGRDVGAAAALLTNQGSVVHIFRQPAIERWKRDRQRKELVREI